MREIKKIVFLGNFSVPYCTEVHHARTYEKLGIEVIRMQEGVVTADQLISAVVHADAFCWTHTHSWRTEGIEGVLALCKERGIPSYGYHLDLWLGIEREKDLENDPFWRVEHFFSVDPEMVDLLNSKEYLPKGYFLPAGVFEDECYRAEANREKYPHDVIFVGSRGYHPEWPYRAMLIEWLENTYGSRFAQYGGGGLGTIRGHELNVLYASAKVVVGDTLCPNFTKPYYLSDRIFETTGRGGMMIHPYIKGIEGMFKCYPFGEDAVESSEVAVYDYKDFDMLEFRINHLLQDDVLREGIRWNGFERTKREHTYTQRLTQLLEVLRNV